MATWLSQLAIACIALIIARYLIHIVLSLKYNFEYSHLGFLSISGIKYHLRTQDASLRTVTFNIGKIKLRLRHRLFQSHDDTAEQQRALVTLNIQNVEVVLHDLALLRKQAWLRKELREEHKQRRGGSLVSVGESLTRIPWWYSFSVVKWVIRTTSAIPAQLIISGLAQYFDVRFEDLQLVVSNVATFRLENATLSSMLFADVQRKANDPSSPINMRDQLTDASMFFQELLINAKHQQHSFKKANHLWKEKFFEVNATLGPMRIVPLSGNPTTTPVAISLPARSHMALSCHLSAACTTLKNLSLDVRVGNIDVDADQIMSLYHSVQQTSIATQDTVSLEENHDEHKSASSGLHRSGAIYTHNRTNSADRTNHIGHKPRSSMSLLKELTISISDIEVSKYMTSDATDAAERLALCIETTSIICVRDQCGEDNELQQFPHSATFATKGIELAILPFVKDRETISSLFAVSGIEASVKATESLLSGKKQALTAQIVDTFAADLDHATEDPNLQYVKGSIDVLSPRVTLDLNKLASYQQILSALTPPTKRPRKKASSVPTPWQFRKVPRFTLSIGVGSPKLFISHPENVIQEMPECTGIDIEDILITFGGNYIQMSGEPASPPLASPLGSPTQIPDTFLQAASPPQSPTLERPPAASRWKTLLRKSWRSYSRAQSSNRSSKNWTFDVLANVRLLGCSSAFPSESTDAAPSTMTPLDNTLVYIDEINISARTSLNASILVHGRRHPPLMQFVVDNPLIDFCLSIEQPNINLWSAYGNRKQLSIFQQAISSTLELSKALSAPKLDNPDGKKPNRAFALPPYMRSVNISFAVHNVCFGIVGTDEGIGGQRLAPEGYIDNAPSKDTNLGLALYIESLSICYKSNQANTDRTLAEIILEMPHNESMLGTVDIFLTGSGVSPCVGHSGGQISYLTGLGGERDCFIHVTQFDSRALVRLKSDGGVKTIVSKSSISFGRILVYYTLQNHYATLLAILALKRSGPKKFPVNDEPQRPTSKIKFEIEKCGIALHHVDIRGLLPGDLDLFLRMKEMHFEVPLHKMRQHVQIRSMKLFGIAPSDTCSWDEIIGIDDLLVVNEKNADVDQPDKGMVISSSGVHVCIPFEYVVANIIDNAVNTFKSLKLLHGRLFSGNTFDWNGPTPKDKPIRIPNIRLRFEILTFAIEDDPFEGRLRLIYKTGAIQQKIRLANEVAFMAKAQSVESQQQQKQDHGSGRRGIDGEQVRDGFLNGSGNAAGSSRPNQSIPVYQRQSEPMSEKSNISVNVAWNRLQEHNANVWIRHIRAAYKEEEKGVQALCDGRRQYRYKAGGHGFGQRTLDFTSKYLADLFDIELVPPPKHPPLLFSALRHMDLTISIPTFPLDETRLFMQKIGDGIPLNTEFSTLAPFHLNWFADETWVQLRDYPLPLMYVPPSMKKDQNNWPRAWSLSGDYVFGDELGSKLATRLVDVTMLDVQDGPNYRMSIPRTSSPPKFYSIVEIRCLCSNPARMSWAQSMQPAIQDVARVFDYFTRPPIDPSEKLGFWDKIRHIIHTRTRIAFGGDFAVCLKGTRDPYDLLGRGAGFVKIWSKEVQWLLGYQNPQNEFMQILSQEYMLAVPDIVNGSYVVKHILPTAGEPPKSRQRSETTSATLSPPTQVGHADMRKSKTTDLASSSGLSTSSPDFRSFWPTDSMGRSSSSNLTTKTCFERKHLQKIGLKLSGGVRWGLGCKYERTCESHCLKCGEEGNCRLLDFIPHYRIKYSTPANVAKRFDGGKVSFSRELQLENTN
jgi:hypothetical protein